MRDRVPNVMFLCSGNAGLSLMAEAILRREGGGRFRVFSAGSSPKAAADARMLDFLHREGYGTDRLRPKSWDTFFEDGAPSMDYVISLCRADATQECPFWPGQPSAARWTLPGPSCASDPTPEDWVGVFRLLYTRINIFALQSSVLRDRLALQPVRDGLKVWC